MNNHVPPQATYYLHNEHTDTTAECEPEVPAQIRTERGDVARVIASDNAIVLTLTDWHDTARIRLTPAEARRLAELLNARATIAEHE